MNLTKPKSIQYTFQPVVRCNMCGSDSAHHKILGRRLNRPQGRNPTRKIGISITVVRCTKCGLVYSNPMPIPKSIQDHYGVDPEEYWNSDYFSFDDEYFKEEIQTLKRLYPFAKGDKALDIGVGLGKSMNALNKAGFDTFGIEPSETFIERAIEKNQLDPSKVVQGSIENVELSNNFFDFITFGAVLEHLYDPADSIDRAMKWLKVGGIMQIEIPSSDWLVSKIVNTYYKLKGIDYVTNISPMHRPFHLYEFTLKSFIEHSKNSGYDILHHEYYVCKTYMPNFLDFFLVPYMKFTNRGMQLCVWLKKINDESSY